MPNPPPIRSPPYADYLYDLYRGRLLADQPPITTTDPTALEQQARETMQDGRSAAFGYIAGGAGSGSTMTANRRALDRWALVPRIMRSPRSTAQPGADLRTILFGRHVQSPVVMAPVGVQSAYHADCELGTAAACAELDVPYCISTASSSTIEEIADTVNRATTAADGDARVHPWYQLYWPRDDDVTASLLGRARAAGCRVLVVTVDTFTISWRPTDLDAGYLPFITTGEGNAIGFSDAVFRAKLARDGDQGEEPVTPESHPLAAALRWTAEAFPRHGRPWEDLAILRRLWGDDGAIVVKGVLHAEDARLARMHGADGIVVSNHGGRQVDGAVASLDVLPDIVKAVRAAEQNETGSMATRRPPPLTILFDSGIRTGADIVKAVCLGAQAVLVGRPVIYGLGIAGKEGAKHVLAGLLADLDQTMSLIGCAALADLGPHMLRPSGVAFKPAL